MLGLNDEHYMRIALQLAEAAVGQTGINPAVGSVIVKDGRIVGLGSHLRRGEAHAEIHALNMAGSEAQGATVYVTLEPCSIHGRTPPCCERLISERVGRVVVGCLDPNPLVAGNGVRALKANGIEVASGVLEQEAASLNDAYNKFIVTRMPFVTAKTASTLDGKIAAYTGDSRWVSGPESREAVHRLRHRNQAILVGVDTAIADDPQLSSRHAVPSLQPIRVVADSQLRLPPTARLLQDATAPVLILTTGQAPPDRRQRLRDAGAELIDCGDGPHVDLQQAMRQLGQREIASILLEGGGRLNGAMLEQRLIDKIVLFLAPKIIGGDEAPSSFRFAGFERMEQAIRLQQLNIERYGDDVCLTGYPEYSESSESPESRINR
ncbi:MAG: 5-amino-6-(5-phosphoribosylamino)uracil reductase [Paenibacillaceae bacterium]|jgi:diaminohydroxyphosphoribosylaminopyrimidine deaminase/5-amino-6-(5-phosphoribosylamino)uracil reductase|nr:5-amino-6-(5-phosphoribosylamino)uracil reductase [Paenibacillaceae bacterium]